jgi:hypothetical protein
MRVTRLLAALALVAAASALPLAAHAQPPAPADLHDEAEPKFPMPAAEFRDRVSRHIEEARLRMEQHIADKQLPADRADEHRARFRAAVAQIQVKVDEVCADGKVTQEEAEAVHELARSLLHHHHHQN